MTASLSSTPSSNTPLVDMALGHVREGVAGAKGDIFTTLAIASIRPAAVNDKVYKPICVESPDAALLDLAKSIASEGVLEPIVLTCDRVIVSGHRRYGASKLAGLTKVPVRILSWLESTSDQFLPYLVAFNKQREKSLDEVLREMTVQTNPEEAYQALQAHRREKSRINLQTVRLEGIKTRSRISEAKMPFLKAALNVIEDLRDFLPLSLRQIHYQLLNDSPLMNTNLPDSRYQNQQKCYKQLSDLLTRARLEGFIAMDAIADETRPVTKWLAHDSPREFLREELDGLFRGYYRNLLQSQPNHIEIIGEKNTLRGIVRPVAGEFGIPYTTGRGYCSTPPKHDMAQRYRRSGKEKLIVLSLSDFDPDGEAITHSFARDLRDEHGVRNIEVVKVALTHKQVRELGLVPNMEAKKKSGQTKKFVEKYGPDVFELEAVPPAELQRMLRDAIDSVLDIDAFNAEVDRCKQDAAFLEELRQRAIAALGEDWNLAR